MYVCDGVSIIIRIPAYLLNTPIFIIAQFNKQKSATKEVIVN